MLVCFVYKPIFILKSEKHSSRSKKRLIVCIQKSEHPSNGFTRTIKSLYKWRYAYLMVDISKVLFSASKIYSILFIIKSLLHVNRLNKVNGVTSKIGAGWFNFTKIVNERCTSSLYCAPNIKFVVRKSARTRRVKERQPEGSIRTSPY